MTYMCMSWHVWFYNIGSWLVFEYLWWQYVHSVHTVLHIFSEEEDQRCEGNCGDCGIGPSVPENVFPRNPHTVYYPVFYNVNWVLDVHFDSMLFCKCSISYGMVFAVAYLLAQRYNFLDDNNHGNLFSPGIALSATLASIIGMGSYTTFSFLCRNKLECNEIHSYTVFVPVSRS